MTCLSLIEGGLPHPRSPHATVLMDLRAAVRALERGALGATAMWLLSAIEALEGPSSSCACGRHGAGHGVAIEGPRGARSESVA